MGDGALFLYKTVLKQILHFKIVHPLLFFSILTAGLMDRHRNAGICWELGRGCKTWASVDFGLASALQWLLEHEIQVRVTNHLGKSWYKSLVLDFFILGVHVVCLVHFGIHVVGRLWYFRIRLVRCLTTIHINPSFWQVIPVFDSFLHSVAPNFLSFS